MKDYFTDEVDDGRKKKENGERERVRRDGRMEGGGEGVEKSGRESQKQPLLFLHIAI